jgi:hypothetical protein
MVSLGADVIVGDCHLAARKGISDARLKAALMRSAGMYGPAAHALGVSRQCVRQRVMKSPALSTFVEDLDAANMDQAEAVIIRQILAGDVGAARWYLDRKAKSRGYGKGRCAA